MRTTIVHQTTLMTGVRRAGIIPHSTTRQGHTQAHAATSRRTRTACMTWRETRWNGAATGIAVPTTRVRRAVIRVGLRQARIACGAAAMGAATPPTAAWRTGAAARRTTPTTTSASVPCVAEVTGRLMTPADPDQHSSLRGRCAGQTEAGACGLVALVDAGANARTGRMSREHDCARHGEKRDLL